MSKDVGPPIGSKSKESKLSSSKGTKSHLKSFEKYIQAEEPVFETTDTKMQQVQGERPLTPDPDWNTGKTIDFRPPHTWISRIAQAEKPPFTFDECYKAITDRLDWTNPKGQEYPFDLSKPLPLIEVQDRQVVHADYLINNDLGYLKGGSLSRKYTTSTTKTKAAKYDNIEGIEDIVLTLWSPVKVAYDKDAL
ncbi:hypothetical protein Tco_0526175 [Tanacetum coccineum]